MKLFQRRIENFTCEHCGLQVTGTGYTNHCPRCLWSKHVDIHPGDRAASCGGLMKPISVDLDHGEYILIHKCEKCGQKKKNRVTKADNFDIILQLSQGMEW